MKILITGGAGFVGTNLAAYFAEKGHKVTIIDNLSRKGTESNLRYLYNYNLEFKKVDIFNQIYLENALSETKPDSIIHLAANTAVTISVRNPQLDFDTNVVGTFNLLEAVRKLKLDSHIIYFSTNKVYGALEHKKFIILGKRYIPVGDYIGPAETDAVDAHAPYGCCYTENTKILTNLGWKKFVDLDKTEKIATYNIDNQRLEYQYPINYFSYDYEGIIYNQKNKRLDTEVTPNHKMLIGKSCNHNYLKTPRLIEAKNIFGQYAIYLASADFKEGVFEEYFALPAVEKDIPRSHYFPKKKIPMNKWLKFLGWYLSEGNIHFRKKGYGNCKNNGYIVQLTSKYRINEAVQVFEDIGFSAVVSAPKNIVTCSKQLYKYLSQFGKCKQKFIPRDILNLKKEQLEILLKSLLEGDGNKNSKNSWRYSTISKKLAADIQELAIKCGYGAQMKLDKENFYRVYICSTRTIRCNLDKNRCKWKYYKGKIFCIEVPNSVILVKQNGKAYFSGNSKLASDQYVRDYYRIYNIDTTVLRMGAMYGPHQFGIEDQGWVSFFTIQAILNRPITIYGDGNQVRDILDINDVISLVQSCIDNRQTVKGEIFNAGGGMANSYSLLEYIDILKSHNLTFPSIKFADWRLGDQKYYVSNIEKVTQKLGWLPQTSKPEGIKKLIKWTRANIEQIQNLEVNHGQA